MIMYNFDGVKFQMLCTLFEFIILSIIFLLLGVFGKKFMSDFKDFEGLRKFLFFASFFLLMLGLSNFAYNYYSIFIKSDSVDSIVSVFEFEERPSHSGIDTFFVMEYVFIDENNNQYCVTMDTFSKDDIFSEDFQKNEKYLISYTKTGLYIVGVEKLSE